MGNQLVRHRWPVNLKFPDFGHVLENLSIKKPAKTYFDKCISPIGIEVEVEGISKEIHPLYLWRPHEDGSLKDHGKEYVSKILSGVLIDYALSELFQEFKYQGKLSWSHRTSIHVHINISDLPVTKIKWLIAYYALTEPLWYVLCDEKRIGNSFCFPVCSMGPTTVTPGKSWPKYCGLNLGTSLYQFNTVEFRHMHGHQDFNLYIKWILKIHNFIEYIKNTPVKKLKLDLTNYLMIGEMDFKPILGEFPENIYSIIYDNAKWVASFIGDK